MNMLKDENQDKSVSAINQDEIQYYLKELRRIKVMTPDREKELSKKIQSGEITDREKHEIEQELLQGNLRFVITIAKQYQNQGVDLSDLIAEGNIGLMRAIHNFDWTKKLRFISYAVWWVRQSILQSLNENARTIRLPVNVVQDLHKAKKELESKGTELEDRFANLPKTTNIEETINEDGDTLLDVLVNPDASKPDDFAETKDILKEKLFNIMSVLDDRERMIVEDYFGMTGSSRTLEDIGNDFNLTKERVRQIKEKALRKLRNESDILFDYL